MDKYVKKKEESTTPPQRSISSAPERRCSVPSAQSPRKRKRFRTGLIIYLAALAVLSISVLIVLWGYLNRFQKQWDIDTARLEAERASREAYEKAISRAPQLAFEDWKSQLTVDYWTDLWLAHAATDLEERGQVYTYMAERFASDAVKAYKAMEFTNETPVYVLKNGDETLARVVMSGSELTWKVSNVDLLVEGTHSASVWIVDGCRVFCNGRELDSEFSGESSDYFNYEPLAGKLVNPVTWLCYTVDGLLLEPEISVEPPENRGLIKASENVYLLCLEDDATVFTDKAVQFVQAYLNYYMSGRRDTRTNLNKALSFLTTGTRAYKSLSGTYNGVVWNASYDNIDTSKTFADNVIVWADNCYSVDVTYNADCTSKGNAVDYADATMRIYFLQTGSGFVISDFEIL